MNMQTIYQVFSRILFLIAFAALAIACIEYVVNLLGYTVLREAYTPGRLVELAGALLLFVIAVLLRQIRDLTRGSDSS